MTDPLVDLLRDLEQHGRPSLAWTVRWSRHGEPVRAAWDAAQCPAAMLDVLRLAAQPWLNLADAVLPLGVVHQLERGLRPQPPALAVTPEDEADVLAGYVEALAERRDERSTHRCGVIRDRVPIPPTLTELLAALRS